MFGTEIRLFYVFVFSLIPPPLVNKTTVLVCAATILFVPSPLKYTTTPCGGVWFWFLVGSSFSIIIRLFFSLLFVCVFVCALVHSRRSYCPFLFNERVFVFVQACVPVVISNFPLSLTNKLKQPRYGP